MDCIAEGHDLGDCCDIDCESHRDQRVTRADLDAVREQVADDRELAAPADPTLDLSGLTVSTSLAGREKRVRRLGPTGESVDRAEMSQPVEAETLDLTGPGVEEPDPDEPDMIRVGGLVHFHIGLGLHIGTVHRITTSGAGTLVEVEASGHTFRLSLDEVSACRTISCVKPAAREG